MKNRYHCKLHGLFQFPDGAWGLKIEMIDDHAGGMKSGKVVRSSDLHSLDFKNGVAVTNNSVYVFDPADLKQSEYFKLYPSLRS